MQLLQYLFVILRIAAVVAAMLCFVLAGTPPTDAAPALSGPLIHAQKADHQSVLIRGQEIVKPALKSAAKSAAKSVKDAARKAKDSVARVIPRPEAKPTNRLTSSTQARAPPITNKTEGDRREREYYETLKKEHPNATIIKQADLRNSQGEIVKDVRRTKTGRRIDFVVVENGKVIKSVEVTSLTAPKDRQILKERRIRQDYGGNYVRDPNSKKLYILKNMETGKNIDTDIVRLP